MTATFKESKEKSRITAEAVKATETLSKITNFTYINQDMFPRRIFR